MHSLVHRNGQSPDPDTIGTQHRALVARVNAAEAQNMQNESMERELSLLRGELAVHRATARGFRDGEASLRSSVAHAHAEAQVR